METATALGEPESGVDLVLVFNLGSSASRSGLSMPGPTLFWQQSSSFRIRKEVTGRCLAWMPWLPEGPGAPGLERIGLAAHRGGDMAARPGFSRPDVITPAVERSSAPSSPWRAAPQRRRPGGKSAAAASGVRPLPQWACFDTPVFQTAPWSRLLSPMRWRSPGAGRACAAFGFHGLNHQHISRGGDGRSTAITIRPA